ADLEERQRVWAAVPNLLHDPATDRRATVFARQPETPLDLGVQPLKLRAERPPVDRVHFDGGARRHRLARGRSRSARSATAARPTIATPSVIGWNGATISCGTSAPRSEERRVGK